MSFQGPVRPLLSGNSPTRRYNSEQQTKSLTPAAYVVWPFEYSPWSKYLNAPLYYCTRTFTTSFLEEARFDMQLLPFTYHIKLLIVMWMCKKNKLGELSNCCGMVTSVRSFHSWSFCNSVITKFKHYDSVRRGCYDRQITGRVQLKCDGTRWRPDGEVKGKLANGVGSQYSYTTSEQGASSNAHTSAACSRLNWRPRRFKWTRPFRRKTKSGFWCVPSHFKSSVLASDPRNHHAPTRTNFTVVWTQTQTVEPAYT
jgi:hypothetical protein